MTRPRRQWGRIRQLPSGGWQVRYPDPNGQLISAGTYSTKAAADVALAAARTDQGRGAWVDPRAGRVTLEEYASEWLGGRTNLRETTRAKYEHLLARHILPALGPIQLGAMQPSAIRAWYYELHGRRQVTAADAYRLLRAVLNTAAADDMIVKSPCRVKGAGQVKSPERPTASIAELAAAVEAAAERYRLAFLLSAWLQLRRGEVLGLQRRDVDLLHATIQVRRARIVTPGGAVVLGPPKTEAGTRDLAIPPHVMPAIAEHLDRYVGPEPAAWLFTTTSGSALSPRHLARAWDAARRTVGRPDLHLHDLRHSGLTWAAATGASTKELMARGGHASPAAALRYQHATKDRDAALAAALSGLVHPADVVPIAAARGSHDGTRSRPMGHAGGTTGGIEPPAD